MFMLLLAGIGCLALFGFELTRARSVTEREREKALKSVRAVAGIAALAPVRARRSMFLTHLAPPLAVIHRRLWRKQTDDHIATELARAGASRRLTAELYMALRVGLTALGFAIGFLIAHGAGRVLLALVFGAAGVLFPGF